MSWYRIFYWVTIADGVKNFFDKVSNVTLTFSIIFFIVYWIVFAIYNDNTVTRDEEDEKSFKYWMKTIKTTFFWFFSICLVTWTLYVFTPSKKDALLIIAGGSVGNFITSDSSAKEIPYELTLLVREKLKGEIQDIKKSTISEIADTLKEKSKEELIEMIR